MLSKNTATSVFSGLKKRITNFLVFRSFFFFVFISCYMRITPVVTLFIRTFNLVPKYKPTIYRRFLHSNMSTEASVKSRQQPKWHVPAAQPIPVLKFQNSLTKTKVHFFFLHRTYLHIHTHAHIHNTI